MDGDCPAPVRAACPEAFLLQFGALLNESSAIEVRQSLLFTYKLLFVALTRLPSEIYCCWRCPCLICRSLSPGT